MVHIESETVLNFIARKDISIRLSINFYSMLKSEIHCIPNRCKVCLINRVTIVDSERAGVAWQPVPHIICVRFQAGELYVHAEC